MPYSAHSFLILVSSQFIPFVLRGHVYKEKGENSVTPPTPAEGLVQRLLPPLCDVPITGAMGGLVRGRESSHASDLCPSQAGLARGDFGSYAQETRMGGDAI